MIYELKIMHFRIADYTEQQLFIQINKKKLMNIQTVHMWTDSYNDFEKNVFLLNATIISSFL